ncbi:hypothetical protein B9Z55_007448 [Caenorhabditis nigoni]|uniref:BTB domain-containing protein n=1 Tax=Caenorhabditis nigoni TaxID=1611254 RepID=A0A2G5V9P5_9PELO|nr:hypothetical protein B9Z55_007448 [Caenorhabditis nigoni]
MSKDVFEYSSCYYKFHLREFETSTNKGLQCVWKKELIEGKLYFTWRFSWDDLQLQRISGFIGDIIWYWDTDGNPSKVEVNVTDQEQMVKTEINDSYFNHTVRYDYTLIPIISKTDNELYDEMFLPSDKNDAILEVDGMQLHVNRSFLSYHSDFFSALFSSNFKEGQMEVIPVKDVTYEDIGLLLSTIYPKTLFPNDETVPKLLELADRFMIPSAIHHVEYHLLNNTKIDNEKLLCMADRYGMDLLLEKMIKELDTVAKAKKLKALSDYMELSDKTKGKILDKVMMII